MRALDFLSRKDLSQRVRREILFGMLPESRQYSQSIDERKLKLKTDKKQ